MPCLNEAQSIEACVAKAHRVLREASLGGEVIVVDNGSTDGSAALARAAGATVLHQPVRGYGSAYQMGLAAAGGRCIVMMDADDTYDAADIPRFLRALEDGADLVMGNRFTGGILPGAMTWSHRYVGNPALSTLVKLMFGVSVSDTHCGMRAFTADAYRRMRLITTGMEFASEMVVNAARGGLRLAEIPIRYHPRQGESKLRTFRDGWRHLRFMLLYSPSHLFLLPGITACLLGVLTFAWLFASVALSGGESVHVHPAAFASLLVLAGYQVTSLGYFAKLYAVTQGFTPADPLVQRLSRWLTLERGLLLGAVLAACGLLVDALILLEWVRGGYGELGRVREAILAATLVGLGLQMIFHAFFASLLTLSRRGA